MQRYTRKKLDDLIAYANANGHVIEGTHWVVQHAYGQSRVCLRCDGRSSMRDTHAFGGTSREAATAWIGWLFDMNYCDVAQAVYDRAYDQGIRL